MKSSGKKNYEILFFVLVFSVLAFAGMYLRKFTGGTGIQIGDPFVLLSGFFLGPFAGVRTGVLASALSMYAAGIPLTLTAIPAIVAAGLAGLISGMLFRRGAKGVDLKVKCGLCGAVAEFVSIAAGLFISVPLSFAAGAGGAVMPFGGSILGLFVTAVLAIAAAAVLYPVLEPHVNKREHLKV
jgi:uncharacterized membrane protein